MKKAGLILLLLALCAAVGVAAPTKESAGREETVSQLIERQDRQALEKIYTRMYEAGELEPQLYELAKKHDWIVPREEKIPLDDFEIGTISTGMQGAGEDGQ